MSKDLKSKEVAEKLALREKVILGETNSFDIPADLYEEKVLAPAGMTMDQLKKLDRLDCEFIAAMALVGGELTSERLKENQELSEIGMTFNMGPNRSTSIVYNRDGKDHMVIASTVNYQTAEMKRIVAHVNELFDDINS